jgi:mRNA-degrading endonuclease RelE of RelBE toxin-antitoxin system
LERHGKAVARKIKSALEELQQRPRDGKLLKGYKGVRSLPVTTASGEFRVIYRLLESERVILVDLIAPRESVYKLLKNKGE